MRPRTDTKDEAKDEAKNHTKDEANDEARTIIRLRSTMMSRTMLSMSQNETTGEPIIVANLSTMSFGTQSKDQNQAGTRNESGIVFW